MTLVAGSETMIEIVNPLLISGERADALKALARDLLSITMTERQIFDLEMVANGGFAPLQGFLTRPDYEAVLDRMRLADGMLWPVPVCLDISETEAARLEAGQSLALRDSEGFLLAVMHVEDIWPVNREREAEMVFQTLDRAHPGVCFLFDRIKDYYVGGLVEVLSMPIHFDFKRLRINPSEVNMTCRNLGWQRLVGFQTRNPLHRPQFEMTLSAMRQARANLLLMPVVGPTRPGDFDYFTRIRCIRAMEKHYPPNSILTSLLPLALRMAGPRAALWQVIIAKNYGCTHYIIGRDQCNPGLDSRGEPFYQSVATQEFVKEAARETGVEIISFGEMVYAPYEDEYSSVDRLSAGTETLSMSGSEIRRRVREGKKIPEWATFPEVVREMRRAYPTPRKQGFTVFLTGLSGAGKSTIARILYSRFLEIGDRPVTLLDGDIVRQHLSSELGFTKEHRDINVRRIGFVASEITKNRGIAICAPIAPYARTRNEVEEMISGYGGFILVHVATPVEECEKRDRKGMYAKARAGLIKGFTGVDDPYEEPANPGVRLDTTNMSPEEAAQEVLLYLGQKGYI